MLFPFPPTSVLLALFFFPFVVLLFLSDFCDVVRLFFLTKDKANLSGKGSFLLYESQDTIHERICTIKILEYYLYRLQPFFFP